MTAVLFKLKTHFANWREWELNPVVVKELRQAVRNWTVTGMLLLFLVVLFVTSLIFLVSQSFEVFENQRLGAQMFQTFMTILAYASMVFIPMYVGIRLAAERVESNLDLLYISTLTPGRIIRGKLLCGAYTTMLFFSACMPFMAFTNLLRGVDLPTVFFILFFLFLVVCLANQVAIFLACLPVSRPLKILAALGGLIGSMVIIVPLMFTSYRLMRSGIGSMMTARDFWIGLASSCSGYLAVALLLYFLSVALISPPSANRALPVRVYMTAIWLLGLIVCIYWGNREHQAQYVIPWAVFSFLLLVASMIVIICGSDQASLRVRQAIPVAGWRRTLAFLFYSNTAGGLMWSFLLLGITLGICILALWQWPNFDSRMRSMSASDFDEFYQQTIATVAYVIAYTLTALLLHRKLFRGRLMRFAGVLMILLPAAWALVPNIISFFFSRLSWRSLETLQLGNIFNTFILRDKSGQVTHMYFAVAWMLVMMVLNARWFANQARQFRPPDAHESTPAPATPPPLPAQ